MGVQKEVANKMIENDVDYILAVKVHHEKIL